MFNQSTDTRITEFVEEMLSSMKEADKKDAQRTGIAKKRLEKRRQ